jgi:transposase
MPLHPLDRQHGISGGSLRDGHWNSTTFVGGLTTRGLIAPDVLDGAVNGTIFLAWVEQMLAPELTPGDIVVMDNLAAHLSAAPTSLRGIRPEAGWSPGYAGQSRPRAPSCSICRPTRPT